MSNHASEVKPLTLQALFARRINEGKDVEASKVAECVMDSVHFGWVSAGSPNSTSSQVLSGESAIRLKGMIPRYNDFPKTSLFLFEEIVRAWINTDDLEKEKKFAEEFLLSRLEGWPGNLEKMLRDGYRLHQKIYRTLSNFSALQIGHNRSFRALAATLSVSSPPAHLVAIGKILCIKEIDEHFVEHRLPEVINYIKQMA